MISVPIELEINIIVDVSEWLIVDKELCIVMRVCACMCVCWLRGGVVPPPWTVPAEYKILNNGAKSLLKDPNVHSLKICKL